MFRQTHLESLKIDKDKVEPIRRVKRDYTRDNEIICK